jgi:hypothetical protein
MAPHEEDKAMDGLLRRNLARGADHALVCPEPDVLAAYFERSLDADEIEMYELHFSQCARCREQLAAMARADAPAAAAADGAAASSSWAWLGDWRWLAIPAAAALAFAIFGFLWMRPSNKVAEVRPVAPPVALSQPTAMPSPQAAPQLDDKGLDAATASAEKRMKLPSVDIASNSRRAATQNAPTARALRTATRDAASPSRANPPSRGALTAAAPMAKAAQQKQQEAGGSAGIGGSVSETVEVQSAVPAVSAPAQAQPPLPHPAKPAVVAGQLGTATAGGTDGVSVSAETVEVAPATTGANVMELNKAATKHKKSEDKSLAAAAPSQINGALDDSGKRLTMTSGQPVQMILTPDPAILWRFAGSGFVERSTDGGATWQGEQPSEGGRVLAGAAPSANVCWLVGSDGLILVTKDAKNWKKVSPPEDTDFVAVSAEDGPNATVTAADGRKFATHNGGKKWKRAKK